MTDHAVPLSVSRITAIWRDLNDRYFGGALPPIAVVWSRRLTASVGMFVSRAGPRSACRENTSAKSREIRLSLPLLAPLLADTPYGTQELVSTLAHEMIHQWQFDVLKRRPNHGPDFLRKMTEMNRDGALAVTIYHSLKQEVLSLSRFAWRCGRCGRIYRRQRRTIQPRHHHCGSCRGALHEMSSSEAGQPSSNDTDRLKPSTASIQPAPQLELDFSSASL
jgi:predicted SprT family Zn-dependent metalloprotease